MPTPYDQFIAIFTMHGVPYEAAPRDSLFRIGSMPDVPMLAISVGTIDLCFATDGTFLGVWQWEPEAWFPGRTESAT